jgi:Rad3-related DNA helicase
MDKTQATIRAVNDFLEVKDGKAVIFVDSDAAMTALLARFPDAARLTPVMSLDDRQANLDRFRTEPACRLLFGSLYVASWGIDLSVADTIFFDSIYEHEPSWYLQARARVERVPREIS